jgi:hypothetical protein
MLYVDISRYTEKPIQTLRTQFQFWLDKAMWHQPSVLIFDNLEKLLGTELEVLGSFYLSSTCSHTMDSTLTPSIHDNLPRPSCQFSLLRLPTTWALTYLISSLLQPPSRNLPCTRSSPPHTFSNKSYISSLWTRMRASRSLHRSCSGDWRLQGISRSKQNSH